MYRSKIKPKVKIETPNNKEISASDINTVIKKNFTPKSSVRKSLGVTQCRRIGLSRKKVTSSPNINIYGSQNENKTPTSSQEFWENSSQEMTIVTAREEETKCRSISVKNIINESKQQVNTCSVEHVEELKMTYTSSKSSVKKTITTLNQQKKTSFMDKKKEKIKQNSDEKSNIKVSTSKPKCSSVKRTISDLDQRDKTCKKHKINNLQAPVDNNMMESEIKSKILENSELNSEDDILIGFDNNLNSVTKKGLAQEAENSPLIDRIESKENLKEINKGTKQEDILNSDKNKSCLSKIDKQKDSKISSSTKKLVQSVACKSSEKKNKTIIALEKNENIPGLGGVCTSKLETKAKKNDSYFDDSDSDFEELTPVSRKIYIESRKSEKIDKIKKSSTKKNNDKKKNVENKTNHVLKNKTVDKPLSQISSNITNMKIDDPRKSFDNTRSILTNDDDDDIFLPKKIYIN